MEEHQDRHIIGGIMSIISGALGILGALVLVFIILFFRSISNQAFMPETPGFAFNNFPLLITIVYGIMALGSLVLGVLGIVGGVFALQKRHWGWALAGAIAGAITFFPCGIAAIIFIALGRSEFIKPRLIDIPGM